jgi:hypothetical protein
MKSMRMSETTKSENPQGPIGPCGTQASNLGLSRAKVVECHTGDEYCPTCVGKYMDGLCVVTFIQPVGSHP